jgi:hypothetical protein
MIPNWQRRRGAFNHDWLKNQYILAIDAWINLLKGEIADSEFEKRFMREIFVQWESGRKQAMTLVEDFEREMSPRRLLDLVPLARGDDATKAWLGELIHYLWWHRYAVETIVAETRWAIDRANLAYEGIREFVNAACNIEAAESFRPLESQFLEFRASCMGLANAIEDFPNEIRIT